MRRVPQTAQELVGQVRDLFSLPDLYFQLRKLMVNPETSIAQIADLISCDPGISARILRIANSAMLGLTRKVQTISRAVNVLGTQEVHDLVLATSVTRAFSGMRSGVMDMRKYWSQSVFCGMAARRIAVHVNVMDSERLFIEGLLRDIGHLVMYQSIPEIAQAAMLGAQKSREPLHQVERRMLGYDYAAVGAELLALWGIPESLVYVTRHHVVPESATEYQLETNIVHVASLLTAGWSAGAPVSAWKLPYGSRVWQALALDPAAVELMVAEADAGVSEARDLFVAQRAAA